MTIKAVICLAIVLMIIPITGLSCDSNGNSYGGGYKNTDTRFPVISGITLSDITETSITISWATDEPATGNIEYGLETDYGYAFHSPPDSIADKTSHSVTFNGLTSDIVYHFRIKSADNSGNEAISEDYYFIATSIFGVTTTPATYVNSPDGDRYIANVNGYLAGLDNATSARVYFQLGIDTSYGRTSTPVTLTAAGNFSSTFGTDYFDDPVLKRDTTYHFRAVAEIAGGTAVYGNDMAFRTDTYPDNPEGQMVQSVTLEQAYNMYVAGDFDVILQNESYHEEGLSIAGTNMNLSPWCAACMWELHELNRNKVYLLYSGVGTDGENAYNSEVMSMYMEAMGFMNVYFMTPATVSDWADAGYPVLS